ncbi:MAG: SoxR reducing system RseC family protein [Gammaproteobacteria bacterium]
MRDNARAGRVLLADDPVAGRVTASATGLARTVLCAFGWPLVALVAGAALGQTQGEAVGVVGALAGAALGLATLGSFAPALAAGLRLERQGSPQAEQEQGESHQGESQ